MKRSPFNVREAVGSNIKRHRLALGWSQQELADRFGVSRAAVSQYEIGTGEVNASNLPRLADLFGISLLEFCGRKPLNLRPIDRQPTQHAEGSWAVEAAASLLILAGWEKDRQEKLTSRKELTSRKRLGNRAAVANRQRRNRQEQQTRKA